MALFLAGTIGALSAFVMFYGVVSGEEYGILGGAEPPPPEEENSPVFAFLSNNPAIIAYSMIGGGSLSEIGFENFENGVFLDPGQPIGPATRGNLLIYRVRSGDTLSGIAAYFGVSLETLINANPGIRASVIRPGEELNILPVSGVVYTTKEGDDLEGIAKYFSVKEEQIKEYNEGINFGNLGVGVSLIIPGAKSFNLVHNKTGSLPSFGDHFFPPAEGFNWGRLHNYNAVDIANTCGTQIRAAAEGLVVPDNQFGDGRDGWNGGYGRFVLIEHPNGVRTRYAHMASIAVSIGDYVRQGEIIGTMGETGDSSGCHLHFEVYGAVNPMAR